MKRSIKKYERQHHETLRERADCIWNWVPVQLKDHNVKMYTSIDNSDLPVNQKLTAKFKNMRLNSMKKRTVGELQREVSTVKNQCGPCKDNVFETTMNRILVS